MAMIEKAFKANKKDAINKANLIDLDFIYSEFFN